jgi:O-antigen biosynthesis protein WbqP
MYQNYLKRLLDVLVAAPALLLSLPFFVAVWIAIRLSDPGPLLFRQERLGRHMRPFILLKFRTMPVDTGHVPSDQLGAVQIGRVGRFLRRSNIDELPQLLNILRGDMSLVGPRPQMPSQADLQQLRSANGAFAVAPGLTGWAQVNSFDGMTVAQKARFDGEYVRRLSFAFDLQIVLRTFAYLTKRPPVY